jgi:hypothetical protein
MTFQRSLVSSVFVLIFGIVLHMVASDCKHDLEARLSLVVAGNQANKECESPGTTANCSAIVTAPGNGGCNRTWVNCGSIQSLNCVAGTCSQDKPVRACGDPTTTMCVETSQTHNCGNASLGSCPVVCTPAGIPCTNQAGQQDVKHNCTSGNCAALSPAVSFPCMLFACQ